MRPCALLASGYWYRVRNRACHTPRFSSGVAQRRAGARHIEQRYSALMHRVRCRARPFSGQAATEAAVRGWEGGLNRGSSLAGGGSH
jgi:hypothetical protein